MFKRTAAALTALTSVLAASLVLATGAPASAADTPLQLVTPQPWSVVPTDWTGPVEVDTTMAESADFNLSMTCDVADWHSNSYDLGIVDGDGPQQQAFSVPSLDPETETCRITAENRATYQAYELGTIDVSDTPVPDLALSGATLSATYFYPRVVDRYRDTVALSWKVNRRAQQSVRILNSNGSVMRSLNLSGNQAGPRRFTWNGRTNTGVAVAAGTYRIFVTATTPDGTQTHQFYRAVSVRTGLFYVRKSASRAGHVSSVSRSGTCFISRSSYYRTTSLDCWGGRYARAAYAFRLPSNASRVSWALGGRRTPADLCCDGRIVRTGKRVTSTLFRIQVQVTGWRAYDVTSARVSYTTRVRR